MLGLVFAIVAVCEYFYPRNTSPPKETTNWVMPSPWLLELMGGGMWLLMILCPAGLVSQSVPPSFPTYPRAGVCKPMNLRSTIRSASPIDSSIFCAKYRLDQPPLVHTYQ